MNEIRQLIFKKYRFVLTTKGSYSRLGRLIKVYSKDTVIRAIGLIDSIDNLTHLFNLIEIYCQKLIEHEEFNIEDL